MDTNNKTNTLDVDKLEKALDNSTNESIMNFTTDKIVELNWRLLKELKLDKSTALDYLGRLKGYKYVDELPDLRHGAFIRWIPITDPNYLPLNQCGIVCDIKITDDGVLITCKNFMHRHYNFKMDDVIIFQKLSSQELIILSALDHLESEEVVNKNSGKEDDSNEIDNDDSNELDEDDSNELDDDDDSNELDD